MNFGRPLQLPRSAITFLETERGKQSESVVRRLHSWLVHKNLTVSAMRAQEVEDFLRRPFRALINPRSASTYKRALIHYLFWLFERGELTFQPRVLGIRRRRPLPPLADTFARTLEPTHRPSTCQGYRTTLHQFHEWLDDARIRPKPLTRPQMEQWLLSLSDQGLHPSTRIQAIQQVRAYLRWLAERGELRRDPDDLVRSSDLPKLPSYLPRPLPPDVDRELQARLARSLSPLWKGLLLMRHTGLRIGELRTLEYDCIRKDPDGNSFLKVPLGKLNSERLVPIGPATCAIIHDLQQSGILKRIYLLEDVSGGTVPYPKLTEAFRRACEGLQTPERITSHRLRHTYATSLLNAGMSIVAVMKLLGHRDYRMTLRYTAITQETVGKEYFQALGRLEARYAALRSAAPADAVDPVKALTEVLTWIKHQLAHDAGRERLARNLSKRLMRIREEIESTSDRAGPRKN